MLPQQLQELRNYPQWVTWRLEADGAAKAKKVPYSPRTGQRASPTNPATWGSFAEAIAAAPNYSGIGFVLTESDPYSFIDLDVAPSEAPDDEQKAIYHSFRSYAERSPGGNGLHIIVKGKVPTGIRRGKVEIYSSQHYMTVTGNVARAVPIADETAQLQALWAYMGGEQRTAVSYDDVPQLESDEAVISRAANAANGGKFKALYEGRWTDYYKSQSEADLALVNIVAFYTQNRAQIASIFRSSGLGQRDKAQRDDYLNGMLKKASDQQLAPVDVGPLMQKIAAVVEANKTTENRYQPKTAAQLKEQPPVGYRVKGAVPSEGLMYFYGASGSGKSFVVLDMATAIAEARPWFGHRTRPACVLYVALEGEAGYRNRVIAWEIFNQRTFPDGVRFISGQAFQLTDSRDVQDLAQAIIVAGARGCVVIIDTLNRAAPMADENSSKDMGAVIEGAKRLQRLTGGLVTLVAHTGKDASRGLRGHSSQYAAADAAILVNREGDVRSWKVEKSKDGADGIEHHFGLNVVPIGIDEDGDEVTSCVVVPSESAPVRASKPLAPNQQLALDTLNEAMRECKSVGVHVDVWRKFFYRKSPADNDSAKQKAFQRAREALVEIGKIKVEDNVYRPDGPNAAIVEKSMAAVFRGAADRQTATGQTPDT